RAAVGAHDLCEAALGRAALLLLELLDHLVLAEPLVAVQALRERVGEDADVAGGDPHLAREDHGRVEADDVVTARDHRAPPLLLDVLLELGAERPVVPRGAGSAVDLARGEDEPAPLGEGDDGVETGGGRGRCGHGHHSWCSRPRTWLVGAGRVGDARTGADRPAYPAVGDVTRKRF